jgi:hypothetical protein
VDRRQRHPRTGDCDALIAPVVTGTLDQDLLADLAARAYPVPPATGTAASTSADYGNVGHSSGDGSPIGDSGISGSALSASVAGAAAAAGGRPAGASLITASSGSASASGDSASGDSASGDNASGDNASGASASGDSAGDADAGSRAARSAAMTGWAAGQLLVADAAALLSGPRGLAGWLRTSRLTGPAASVSLPLDLGRPTETVPAWLRKAVALRDQHCGFPGCEVPPEYCQVHHIVPRAEGGPTSLENTTLGCSFHHLIVVHRWGWRLTLNPDGTKTAVHPRGYRTLHSHAPPAAA